MVQIVKQRKKAKNIQEEVEIQAREMTEVCQVWDDFMLKQKENCKSSAVRPN